MRRDPPPTVPRHLWRPCDKPEPGELRDGRALAAYALELESALDRCSARIEAIRVIVEAPREVER